MRCVNVCIVRKNLASQFVYKSHYDAIQYTYVYYVDKMYKTFFLFRRIQYKMKWLVYEIYMQNESLEL